MSSLRVPAGPALVGELSTLYIVVQPDSKHNLWFFKLGTRLADLAPLGQDRARLIMSERSCWKTSKVSYRAVPDCRVADSAFRGKSVRLVELRDSARTPRVPLPTQVENAKKYPEN
jgi:hypothetical protein